MDINTGGAKQVAILLQDLMKRDVCRCGVGMLLVSAYWCGGSMAFNFVQILSQVCVSVLALPPPHCFYFLVFAFTFEDRIWPKHGFIINSQIECFIQDSYSSSKGRVYCASIIRRKGTGVSHMPSFPLASLFSFSKNFLPCVEYPFAHASRVYFV